MDNARPPRGPGRRNSVQPAGVRVVLPSFSFILYGMGILAPVGWHQQDRIDEYALISRFEAHETCVPEPLVLHQVNMMV